jgi:uncharacterized protein (TIGR02246 family)
MAILLLIRPQPLLAQTTDDQPKQLTDEEIGKIIEAADSYTVDAVNRHDAYAVAAAFWEDGIEITPQGIFSGRATIERHLTEDFKATDIKDFTETWDEVHISGDHGWYIAHWTATGIVPPSRERRSGKGYITGVLERRNGEWKVRLHTTFPSAPQ